jgi:WD40 repeat protein
VWRPPGRRARVLKGHDRTQPLHAAALSVGGRVAVTGGGGGSADMSAAFVHRGVHTSRFDGRLYVWDTVGGRLLRVILAHQASVESVAVSGDGRIALSTGWGTSSGGQPEQLNQVRLWDLRTGAMLRELGPASSGRMHGGGSAAGTVHLSADGRLAVAGSSYLGTPTVWSTSPAGPPRFLDGHRFTVGAVLLSRDGRLALTGGVDKTIRLWEVETGRCRRVLHGHTGAVYSVAMNGDGRYVLSGAEDKTVRLWELDTGRCLYTLRQDDTPYGVRHVALSADGRHALTAAARQVRFWRLPVGVPGSFQLCRPRSPAELDQTARRIATLIAEGEHAIAQRRYARALSVLTEARETPGYERAPEVLAAWHRLGGVVERTGLRGAWPVGVFEGHESWISACCLSRDGRLAVSVSQDETMRVWDVQTGRCLRSFDVGYVGFSFETSLALTDDGRSALLARALSGEIWDLDSGQRAHTFEGHTKTIRAMRLCADGRLILSAAADGTIRAWDTATGQCLAVIETDSDGVSALSASTDGRLALSSGSGRDHTVGLWEVATGRLLHAFQGHTETVRSVALTADERLAVSASADQTIRVWDIATGRCLRVLQAQTEFVSIDVTMDGRFAVSCGQRKLRGQLVMDPDELRVRVWDLRTGQCLRALEGHTGPVESVGLSRDEQYVLSGGRDGTLRLWKLDRALRVAEA